MDTIQTAGSMKIHITRRSGVTTPTEIPQQIDQFCDQTCDEYQRGSEGGVQTKLTRFLEDGDVERQEPPPRFGPHSKDPRRLVD
jgi:hypothetical protein